MKKKMLLGLAIMAMAMAAGPVRAIVTCSSDDSGLCKDTDNPCSKDNSALRCVTNWDGVCCCNGCG
jgi:hypothetical protein